MRTFSKIGFGLFLGFASYAALAKNTNEIKRKPASAGDFICTWASGNSVTLETEMKAGCDTKQPFSIAATEKNGVTRYTYCCTAK